ncbi:MAG: endonuclease/exonuclease/phosphatase family protein [Clostridia bacterium]|nr:endonuclease/exonuclease/phosphatase family protein [Clostridia bacterium]
MKFATYNICHCGNYENWKKGDDLPVKISRTADVIAEIDADIIGLNEVYTDGATEDMRFQTEKLAKLAGYPYSVFAVGKDFGWTAIGNSILSKYPIVNVKKIAVPAPAVDERDPNENDWYEDRVLLCVEIDVNGKTINVISSHFGLNPTEQRRIVAAACKEIDEKQGDVVMMGDFNVPPDSEFLSPLYARLKSAAKETGNVEFTFSTYAPHIQIDYIFYPKTATVKAYTVYKSRVSDHRPISAEIKL